MAVKLTALQDTAGATVGQSLYLSPGVPDDATINGRRYLKAGLIETNPALFDTSIFTAKFVGSLSTVDMDFGTTTITALAYGNGRLVVVGGVGKVSISLDGSTFVAQTPPLATQISDGAFGAGLFVIVSSGGQLLTSPDGITWTSRASGFGADAISKVDYVNGVFIAQGIIGGNVRVSTSSDGVTWTLQAATVATSASPSGVIFFKSEFVLAASNGFIYRSVDAVTWDAGTNVSPVTAINSIAASGTRVVVCGNSGQVASSENLTTWVAGTSGYGGGLYGLYFDSVFVMVGGNAGVRTSASGGDPWTTINSGASPNYRAAGSGFGKLFVVGDGGNALEAPLTNYAGSTIPSTQGAANRYVRIT